MMRLFVCTLVAAGCLFACERPPDAERNTPAPPPDPQPAGNAAVQPPAAQPERLATAEAPPPALAERFLGSWDVSAAACAGPPGEMRLAVEPGRLRFHESVARVEAVRPAGAESVEVDLAFAGEGESWRETRTIRLLPDNRLAVDAAGPPAERVRCE